MLQSIQKDSKQWTGPYYWMSHSECCCNHWLSLICHQFFSLHLLLSYLLPYIKCETLTFFKGRDKRRDKLMHAPKCMHTLTNYHSICLPTDNLRPGRQCESAERQRGRVLFWRKQSGGSLKPCWWPHKNLTGASKSYSCYSSVVLFDLTTLLIVSQEVRGGVVHAFNKHFYQWSKPKLHHIQTSLQCF